MLQRGCGTDCDEEHVTANRQLLTTAVEMSTLARTSNAQSFHQGVKSYTRVERFRP